MVKRLASATSPYLLQHADNPVDWWEWSPEALAEAERLDRPILLSVGYAACHWCHVMAHDSFEDAQVAALLNENFISIKVDREERPDIDAVYMQATVALTGQGGWPMTCLLMPDGTPFFAGTFIPKHQFIGLLGQIVQAWRGARAEVVDSGRSLLAHLQLLQAPSVAVIPTASDLDAAVTQLAASYDEANGGFGRAPKFPPSMVLEFLLRNYARTGDDQALRMVEGTCEAMAHSGMYDQLAGGFSRYSVDSRWVVPHFEKMLYDNALLLRVYLLWWRMTGAPLGKRIAREIADFMLRDLLTAEGGFASALDADTDGVEGLTYVWTPAQLMEVLGPSDAVRAAELLSVTPAGTFDHGSSTLQLRAGPDDAPWWTGIRATLLAARNARPQPARDDKVVTAWNGLAIAALAEAGVLLEEPRFLQAAITAAELLLECHLVQGRLRRASRGGVVGLAAGVAEDYAGLAEGLLMLHQATTEPRWLTVAGELLQTAVEHFAAEDGGFFDTADDAQVLVTRPREESDNATPSGTTALAGALLSYSALTGSLEHRGAAERALASVGQFAASHPRFAGYGLAVAEALLAGPVELAIALCPWVGFVRPSRENDAAKPTGPHKANPGTQPPAGHELVRVAWVHRPPGAVIVVGEPDTPGVPLLQARPLVEGQPTAYLCRGMVCQAPVTSVDDLLAQL